MVGEYRLVDKRSTVSPLLVPKPGDNPKVWDLVEEQTLGLEVDLRTGDYERELEAPFYHCWCPGGGDVFLSKSVKSMTHTHTPNRSFHINSTYSKSSCIFCSFSSYFAVFLVKNQIETPLEKKKKKISVFFFCPSHFCSQ